MSLSLLLDREAIVALCRRHGVARLSVFGSALTDRFDPNRSDVDMTVEFVPDLPDRFGVYFGLKEDLEQLLERPVDLLVRTAIDNPFFAA
ncbi:MAG: nucleotidyltransferase domain-containing protein, partial [Propionicimonas sp.]